MERVNFQVIENGKKKFTPQIYITKMEKILLLRNVSIPIWYTWVM